MVSLSTLWLPILVSAVFVFIASYLLWMALPFWHRKDYKKLPDEGAVLGALKNAASGQYLAVGMDWATATPEEREELWPRFVEMYRGYDHYKEIATREMPVVVLETRS